MSRPPLRSIALVSATVLLAAAAIAGSWTGPLAPSFWFWVSVCLVGEGMWVRLPVGKVTVSMASCFHFAALLLLPVGQAMLVTAATGLIAETFFMRKPSIRAIFNGAQAALAVGAASFVLSLFGADSPNPSAPLLHLQLLPLLIAAATYFAVNSGAVSIAVAVHERVSTVWAWRANFGTGYELLSNATLFALGTLLAANCVTLGLTATALILFPVLVAYHGYRDHTQSRVEEQREIEQKAA